MLPTVIFALPPSPWKSTCEIGCCASAWATVRPEAQSLLNEKELNGIVYAVAAWAVGVKIETSLMLQPPAYSLPSVSRMPTFFVELEYHSGFMPSEKLIVDWPFSCSPGVSAVVLMPVLRPGACR